MGKEEEEAIAALERQDERDERDEREREREDERAHDLTSSSSHLN